MEHINVDGECFLDQIKELAALCDHEYYMSALPITTSKERAAKGRNRVLQAIKELRDIQKKVNCIVCQAEINKQIYIQQAVLKEIEEI